MEWKAELTCGCEVHGEGVSPMIGDDYECPTHGFEYVVDIWPKD